MTGQLQDQGMGGILDPTLPGYPGTASWKAQRRMVKQTGVTKKKKANNMIPKEILLHS